MSESREAAEEVREENRAFVAWLKGLPFTHEIIPPPVCFINNALRHTVASEVHPMWIRYGWPELPLVGRLVTDGASMYYLTRQEGDEFEALMMTTEPPWVQTLWSPTPDIGIGLDVFRMTALITDKDPIKKTPPPFTIFRSSYPVTPAEFVCAAKMNNMNRFITGEWTSGSRAAHLLCELHGQINHRNATTPPGFHVTIQNGFGCAGQTTAGMGPDVLLDFPDLVESVRDMEDDAILDTVAQFVADGLAHRRLPFDFVQPIFQRSFRRSSRSSIFLNKSYDVPDSDTPRRGLFTVRPIIGHDNIVVVPEGVDLCRWHSFVSTTKSRDFTTAELVDWLYSVGVRDLYMFDNSCGRLVRAKGEPDATIWDAVTPEEQRIAKALATQANYAASRKHLSQQIIDDHPGDYITDTTPTFSVSPMDDDAAWAPTPDGWGFRSRGAKGGGSTKRQRRNKPRRTRHRRRNFFTRVRKAKK